MLDKALVETVINNAISNAIKYGDEEKYPKIIVQQSSSGRTFIVTVRNAAGSNHQNLIDKIHTGWSTEELFDKNMRLKDTDDGNRKRSSGHGLWVTRLAANEMNGKVEFSVRKDYSKFSFSIPCEAHYKLGNVEIPNMKIAILDDDRIERLTVEREFSRYEWVDELYIKGSSVDECIDFPAFITRAGIQLALFDENLYDNMNGSDLMVQARKLGYKGLMISRSSMDTISGGVSVLGKISDGFLPKCFRKEDEIKRRIHDVITYSKKLGQVRYSFDEDVSSLTSEENSKKSETFVLDTKADYEEKAPVVFTEIMEALIKANLGHEVTAIYREAKRDFDILLEKLQNISDPDSLTRCSEKSDRPHRYIHSLKGMCSSVGFVKLESLTKHLSRMNNKFNREQLNNILPGIKLMVIESFSFVNGMLEDFPIDT